MKGELLPNARRAVVPDQKVTDYLLSYQDYLEQLTFLLFLKMADERGRLTGEEPPIPAGYRWADLAAPQMEGVELEQHYRETLRVLGQQGACSASSSRRRRARSRTRPSCASSWSS